MIHPEQSQAEDPDETLVIDPVKLKEKIENSVAAASSASNVIQLSDDILKALDKVVEDYVPQGIPSDNDPFDGTQKHPFVGGNVWVGPQEQSPFDENGNDILIGGDE